MKLSLSSVTAVALFIIGSAQLSLFCQEGSVLMSPKVLVIAREFVKPGKAGAVHEEAESAYVKAMANSKNPQHYIAMVSQSGPARALFLYPYASFAAWEEEHQTIEKDASLSAALERADVADGDLLANADASIWVKNDEMSLNPGFRQGARYEVVDQWTLKPGHYKEFVEMAKLVKAAYQKGVPGGYWGAYEEAFGIPGGGVLILHTLPSGAAIDADFTSDERFVAAMGEDGMKKLAELENACVAARQTNLFRINPKMSFPADAIRKGEPDFWKATK